MRNNQVRCSQCKEWKDAEFVEFLDISEDIQGYDLMKFRCPKCKTVQESHVTR